MSNLEKYTDLQADFYHYMVKLGGIAKKTSHIKPWRDADNQERLDAYNGLLLLPNYDKLSQIPQRELFLAVKSTP